MGRAVAMSRALFPLREHRTMYFLSRGSSFMLRVWSCVLLLSADSAWFGPGSGLDTELTRGGRGGSLQWFGKKQKAASQRVSE